MREKTKNLKKEKIDTKIDNIQVLRPLNDSNSLTSIILGIITIIIALFLGIIALPLGIVGIILGIISKAKNKIVAIILNIIGMSIAVFTTILLGTLLFSFFENVKNDFTNIDFDNSLYNTDNFALPLNKSWSKVKVEPNDIESLMYKDNELYLIPVGVESLEDVENKLACNYENVDCQKKLYDNFYNYWNNNEDINQLLDGEEKFNKLKYDADYITINYGETPDTVNGKLYLIVSDFNNMVICFISKSDHYDNSYDYVVIDLLKNILITKN